MQQWLIYRSNNTHGPFTPAQLKKFADAGKLRPTDVVGLVGSEERSQAVKVGGLFDNTTVSSISSPEQSAGDATGSKLYVRVKGRALGPFTHEHLQKMATSGKLNRLSELSKDGLSWARAEDFGIQFGAGSLPQSSHNFFYGNSSTSASATSETKTRPKHAVVDPKVWYVHDAGVNYGPMSTEEFNGLRDGGGIGDDALLSRDGCENWVPIKQLSKSKAEKIKDATRQQSHLPENFTPSGQTAQSSKTAEPITDWQKLGLWRFGAVYAAVVGTAAVLIVGSLMPGTLVPDKDGKTLQPDQAVAMVILIAMAVGIAICFLPLAAGHIWKADSEYLGRWGTLELRVYVPKGLAGWAGYYFAAGLSGGCIVLCLVLFVGLAAASGGKECRYCRTKVPLASSKCPNCLSSNP